MKVTRGVTPEVESLLACEPAAADFIEASALEVAAEMLTRQSNAAGLIGRHVGPYLVESWIGTGGMGDVYRARDGHPLHQGTALQILQASLPSISTGSPGSRREAQVLASLDASEYRRHLRL